MMYVEITKIKILVQSVENAIYRTPTSCGVQIYPLPKCCQLKKFTDKESAHLHSILQ